MNAHYSKGQFVGYVQKPSAGEVSRERWHVVRLRSGREQTAIDFLTPRRFGPWAPLTRVWRLAAARHMSKAQRAAGAVVRKPKVVPIFPGYLFVRFDIERSDWHDVFEHLGIYGLTGDGRVPTVIQESEIDRVRHLAEEDGVIPDTVAMKELLFEVGEKVRVTSGPFASFSGVIEEIPEGLCEMLKTKTIGELDDSIRMRIALSIFGRPTPIDLAYHQIAKA